LVDALAQVIRVEQCAIAIFDERGEYGDVVAEYLEEGCVPSKGVRIPLRDNPIIEIVCKTKRPLPVKDAQHDPRMEKVWDIMKQRRTRSIMIVPIIIEDEVIGTIGLDAVSGPRDFTRQEQWLAETIAHHAAIAIQNARQYEELKQIKGLVGARTALAWIGMVSAVWRHAIEGHAMTIEEDAQALCAALPNRALTTATKSKLARIKRVAKMILEKPITPPLSTEEGAESVPVNDLLRERLEQLKENRSYSGVRFESNLALSDAASVWASPEWLRRAFDILVDNAVEAMAKTPVKLITVTTKRTDGQAEIAISDTGRGIPDNVLPKLFKEPVRESKEVKGLGIGLLMAQTIVQAYGGDIQVKSTGPTGTTMVVQLPPEV
jgi:signal transduction histidine kinase